MAIFLKEIALSYNKETDLRTMFYDYFCAYDLWRKVGDGVTNVQSQRRREIIERLFEEIQDVYVTQILINIAAIEVFLREDEDDHWKPTPDNRGTRLKKLSARLQSAQKMQNREEMHSIIVDITQGGFGEGILPGVGRSDFKRQLRISTENPVAYLNLVSPLVAKILKSNLQFLIGYDKAKDATSVKKKPEPPAQSNWFQDFVNQTLQKTPEPAPPVTSEPSTSIVPPPPTSPIPTPMQRTEPKRLTGAWENVLKTHGFDWDESGKYYKKPNGDWVEVYNDNTATLFSGGKPNAFKNLGLLFRSLNHRKRRHAAPAGNPTAQLNEEHFKDLYRFFYS